MRITVTLAAILGLVPAIATAGGWQKLDGEGITSALAARVLGYPDGTLQDFFSDGRTLQGESWGRWEVRGDRYCSQWPPSDRWSCYAVDQSGLDIRFTDDAGHATTGRYVDLQ
jgi:hypothetical protein